MTHVTTIEDQGEASWLIVGFSNALQLCTNLKVGHLEVRVTMRRPQRCTATTLRRNDDDNDPIAARSARNLNPKP